MLIDPALVRDVVSAFKAVCFELKRQLDPSTTREQILSVAPILTEYVLYRTDSEKFNTPVLPDAAVDADFSLVTTGEQLSKWVHSAANPSQRLSMLSTFCREAGLDMASLNSWPNESVAKAVSHFNAMSKATEAI